jgi:ABC-type sugar transport system ATPase subunit
MTVAENLTMPMWDSLARGGVRRPGQERQFCDAAVRDMRIKTASLDAPITSLSGGNQQKVVIAKWMARKPLLLVLDEPTRGVDVGAKAEIYDLIGELAAMGVGVLLLSSELPELLKLSDRIVVMAKGRVVGEELGADATEESLTAMAFGSNQREDTA